jgi:hypothetical protein
MKLAAGAGALGLAAFAVAGCQSNGKSAADEQSGKAALHAVASNSTVQNDEKNVTANIISPCVAKAAGVHPVKAFETCVESHVTPADRAKVKSCLVKAAGDDNVLTKAGRKQFETVSANQCIAPYISASASPSVSPSPAASK